MSADLIALALASLAALAAILGTVWCWSDYRRIAAFTKGATS